MNTDDRSATSRVWAEIRRVSESLIEVKDTLDDIEPDVKDHEQRLRKLEERRFPLQVIAAYVAVFGLLATLVAVWAETR